MKEKVLHPIGYDDIYIECDNNEMCGACFAEVRINKVRTLLEEINQAVKEINQAIDGKQYGWSGRR